MSRFGKAPSHFHIDIASVAQRTMMSSEVGIEERAEAVGEVAVPLVRIKALSARNLLNLAIPLILIFVAEAFYFTGDPTACVWVHGLNIFLCLLLLILIGDDKGLFQAFSLVSLIRILGWGCPSSST